MIRCLRCDYEQSEEHPAHCPFCGMAYDYEDDTNPERPAGNPASTTKTTETTHGD